MSDTRHALVVLGEALIGLAGCLGLTQLLLLLTANKNVAVCVSFGLMMMAVCTSCAYLPFTYRGMRAYESCKDATMRLLVVHVAALRLAPPLLIWQVGIVLGTACWLAIVIPDYRRRRGEFDKNSYHNICSQA